jgi:hypothetical protein
VIRHEHPEFVDALEDDLDEIDLGYGPLNPRLHLAMHEIVATQLWDGDPPEVWETAVRLRDAEYERHEVLHMLGRPVSDHSGRRGTTISRTTGRVTSPRSKRFPVAGSKSVPPCLPARARTGRASRHVAGPERPVAAPAVHSRKTPLAGLSEVRPRGLEPPRTIKSTRPLNRERRV